MPSRWITPEREAAERRETMAAIKKLEQAMSAMPKVEPIYRAVGANVRKRRLKLGIQQGVFAAKVGLTRTSIINLEKGRQRCMLHDIDTMAKILGTTLHKLLTPV